LGKSKDVSEAIKRRRKMLRKFSKIPLNGPSVPHEQKGKFGGARILILRHMVQELLLVELFVQ
jgi:small subunit ribosomal protein S5